VTSRWTAQCPAGFGLVELLIALALALVLLGAVAGLFTASAQSLRLQEAASRVDENGRHALGVLLRDLRSAGNRGCTGREPAVLFNAFATTYPLDQAHALLPVDGFEARGDGHWQPSAAGLLSNHADLDANDADMITVRTVGGAAAQVLEHPSPEAALLTTGHNALRAGQPVRLADCSDMVLLTLPEAPDAQGRIEHGIASLGRSFAGAELTPIAARTYFIRENARGEPSLFRVEAGRRDAVEIAEGVEDLQILYGLDRDGDFGTEDYATAATVAALEAWPAVRSVRLDLLVRSMPRVTDSPQRYRPLSARPGTQPNGIADAEGRLRRTFSATVALRNRLP